MYSSIVVLTGAGISKESGLNTFRDQGGLWEGYHVEEVATPEAFAKNPELVHRFYNMRRAQLLSDDIRPNLAHQTLADFEKNFEGHFLLVTQNVDNLHERAGSHNLLHMHGELTKVRCQVTNEVFDWEGETNPDTPHPTTPTLSGTLRPHIVWFGEMPMHMPQIEHALSQCDLFIAIGTSGLVYPAAGFAQWTPKTCHRVEINMEETAVSPIFHEHLFGPASKTVPDFFTKITAP